ncbi:MAG TPA: M48 family metalloprotease [Thermoanaerobaculia bacterium]|nr:M48 family metalloprotease [Thermoanaerobaculia bacterium]
MRDRTRRSVAFALALALLASPWRPAAAQTIANPDLFAKSLTVAQEAVEQYGLYDNSEELARVNRIGYELAQHSEFQKFPFTFGLVDVPVPNAFALPGGQIFVTRGMLDLGLDDDMLANVLGHEIAHVTLEHYLRMKRKATLMSVLGNLLVAGILVGEANSNNRTRDEAPYDPRVGRDPGGDLIQGAAAASLILSELLLRSHSREHEDESDKEGQRLAASAGYDPDGARRLWEKMESRAPQFKQYGYWQTHPFAVERSKAAGARKGTWKVQTGKSADDYRRRTQAVLTNYLASHRPTEGETAFLKSAALTAWPQGKTAEEYRLEKLHRQRDQEMAKPLLSRDYGAVVRAYRDEMKELKALDPGSDLLRTLQADIDDLESKRKELFRRAVEVLDGGVYETSFLEAFLSNFPDASQVPEVALALGDAYSRLGNQTDGVTQYLAAFQSGPDTAEGKRARTGLRNLTPNLKELSALQQLIDQNDDPELKRLAADRLAQVVKSYEDVANGAEYLRRFPEGPHVPAVMDRLNSLADNLYGEVVLYQSVGDDVKAIERINKILTHAPLSPAAEKLRDRAQIPTEKAG